MKIGIGIGIGARGAGNFEPTALDPDAADYISRVETADGQALEPAIVTGIDTFVKGLKSDASGVTGLSNWDQVKLFAPGFIGRTLNGGFEMLKGTLVSNNGPFVSGDYDRTLGLIGNETDYLQFGRTTTDDPVGDNHMAIFCTQNLESGSSTQTWFGNHVNPSSESGGIITVGNILYVRVKGEQTNTGQVLDRFCGFSQNSSESLVSNDGAEFSVTGSQTEITTEPIRAFYPGDIRGMNSRMVCMSAGGSVDLAAYRSRVTQFVTDIQGQLFEPFSGDDFVIEE